MSDSGDQLEYRLMNVFKQTVDKCILEDYLPKYEQTPYQIFRSVCNFSTDDQMYWFKRFTTLYLLTSFRWYSYTSHKWYTGLTQVWSWNKWILQNNVVDIDLSTPFDLIGSDEDSNYYGIHCCLDLGSEEIITVRRIKQFSSSGLLLDRRTRTIDSKQLNQLTSDQFDSMFKRMNRTKERNTLNKKEVSKDLFCPSLDYRTSDVTGHYECFEEPLNCSDQVNLKRVSYYTKLFSQNSK